MNVRGPADAISRGYVAVAEHAKVADAMRMDDGESHTAQG
jgi:hypothetical protein